MFARTCTRCLVRPRAGAIRPNVVSARVQRRAFGSAPSGAAAGTSQGSGLGVGTLVPIVSELDRMAPSFDLKGENIRVIRTPAEFYETLKVCGHMGAHIQKKSCSYSCGIVWKLIRVGAHTQCKTTHLPIDAVHWKIRKGAHRNTARRTPTQSPVETEHIDRLSARNSRSSRSIVRFTIGTSCYGIWRRPS